MNTIFKKFMALVAIIAGFLTSGKANAQEKYSPSGTYQFAVKDGNSLFLDEYLATAGSETTLNGNEKPSIVFVFGGGFKGGERSHKEYVPWFKMLNDEGYTVLTIDYRLGMKGVKTKGGIGSVKQFYHSVRIASEDLFSATKYIIDNAKTLKVNPDNLVICGSSAGAMTVLETEWMLCNGKATEALPEGFRYAGVMSFSGRSCPARGCRNIRRLRLRPHFPRHGRQGRELREHTGVQLGVRRHGQARQDIQEKWLCL